MSVIIAKVGAGTRALAEIAVGSVIDVLGPLGHGFDMSCVGDRPVLIGGGSGIPPLYFAAKAAVAQGRGRRWCWVFGRRARFMRRMSLPRWGVT